MCLGCIRLMERAAAFDQFPETGSEPAPEVKQEGEESSEDRPGPSGPDSPSLFAGAAASALRMTDRRPPKSGIFDARRE